MGRCLVHPVRRDFLHRTSPILRGGFLHRLHQLSRCFSRVESENRFQLPTIGTLGIPPFLEDLCPQTKQVLLFHAFTRQPCEHPVQELVDTLLKAISGDYG